MYSGSIAPSQDRSSSAAALDYIRDQPVIAGDHHRLADCGCSRSRASISPSSIAEAAQLHLVIQPAEELDRAVARQRARSPVR